MIYISIFFGGGIGSVIRGFLSRFIVQQNVFPTWLSTLLVNAIGSILIITLNSYFNSLDEAKQYFFRVGLLGGLTTFSAFSFELVSLIKANQFAEASLVFVLNVVFGIVVGILLVK